LANVTVLANIPSRKKYTDPLQAPDWKQKIEGFGSPIGDIDALRG
jgi:hypothetical protein